jgi:hypothetical protein
MKTKRSERAGPCQIGADAWKNFVRQPLRSDPYWLSREYGEKCLDFGREKVGINNTMQSI